MRIAVYTSIFGPYDGLLPQKAFPGVDYICFTDQPFRSRRWDVRQVLPSEADSQRQSRLPKLMPHRFLPDHEVSIFIDGNYLLLQDPRPLVERVLAERHMAVFDHAQCEDARDCVYEEHRAILRLYEETGRLKDDPAIMAAQMARYRAEGYPEHHGLTFNAVLIRRHHEPSVVAAMECWWQELLRGSRRDQLSFNYAAWKTGLSYQIIDGDLRRNAWFEMIGAHRPDYRAKYWRYRLKKFLGWR